MAFLFPYFCVMRILKWALYFIALFAFVWFVFLREYTQSLFASEMNTVETVDTLEEAELVDEWITEGDTAVSEVFEEFEPAEEFAVVEEAEAVQEDPKPFVEETPTSFPSTINTSDHYLVIIGSFSSRTNANKLSERVQAKGIAAEIVEINGLMRVVVASSNDRKEAERLKREADRNNEASYVLKNY